MTMGYRLPTPRQPEPPSLRQLVQTVLGEIEDEVWRAHCKHGDSSMLLEHAADHNRRLAIAAEEALEVVEAMLRIARSVDRVHLQDRHAMEELRRELIQLGAMCATWAVWL